MPNYQPLYRYEHYYYYCYCYYYYLQSILLFLDTVKYCKVSVVQNHFVTCVRLWRKSGLRGHKISRPLNTSCGGTWRIWSIGKNHGQSTLAANYAARWSHEKKRLNYLEDNKFFMNRTELCKQKCGSHFKQ
jgi:hypothetical protein